MPLKMYKCNCGWTGRRLEKDEVLCPECNSPMEVDVISTARSANFERIPGGYDYIKLNEKRRSAEGQEREAAYLSGTSRTAY